MSPFSADSKAKTPSETNKILYSNGHLRLNLVDDLNLTCQTSYTLLTIISLVCSIPLTKNISIQPVLWHSANAQCFDNCLLDHPLNDMTTLTQWSMYWLVAVFYWLILHVGQDLTIVQAARKRCFACRSRGPLGDCKCLLCASHCVMPI